MHRSLRLPAPVLRACLLGLIAWAAAGKATAQEQVPAPAQPIIVPLGGTIPLQMSTKKNITKIEDNSPPGSVITVQTDKKDPSVALVTGRNSGVTVLTLTDVDGRKEPFEI